MDTVSAQVVLDRFLRHAGLVAVPPLLLQDILDWLTGVWAERKGSKKPKNVVSKTFEVTDHALQGWRYYPRMSSLREALDSVLPVSLTVKVQFKPKSQAVGGRNHGTRLIELFPTVLSSGPDVETVEHELTHWTQHFMGEVLDVAGVPAKPGVPPARMLDDVDQNARGDKFTRHRLDDVEFYTVLKDEIRKWENKLRHIRDMALEYERTGDPDLEDAPATRDAIQKRLPELLALYTRGAKRKVVIPRALTPEFSMLGQGLFEVLAKHNQEKWRKAVGIFLHALEPWMHRSTWLQG
jgi:hypothetical protein